VKELVQAQLNRKPLAYRLGESVRVLANGGSPVLLLHFPLKFVVLHPLWRPVLESIANRGLITFERIRSLVGHGDPDGMLFFLNGLVRRGFLEQEGSPAPAPLPRVSIIIPVRNRPEDISACLHSLAGLVYPVENLEIIVVDDASTDNTPRAISEFPVNLISLKEHRQASHCRNLAARKAGGDILAFIDSDCLANALWLQDLVPAFTDPSVGAVGGIVGAYFKESALDRYEEVKSSLIVSRRARRSQDNDKAFYVPSCNLLVRRNLFLQLGGFREELFVGEDVDFCWRMQDAGHHLEFRPEGKVFHKHRNRLWPFCARRFDYGTSEPMLQRLHRKRGKEMVFPPATALFWLTAALSVILKTALPLVLCFLLVSIDTLKKWNRVRRRGLPIRFPLLLSVVLRGYFAFFQNGCAFVSRYYLIWSIFLLPLWPPVSGVILGMHVLTGFVEYVIKKPRLNFFAFIFYFSLEQLSYQSGVWWGCVRNLSFHAVNPKLVCKTR